MGWDIFSKITLLKDLPKVTLNTTRNGASTASLENPFQCLTTLRVKNYFFMSNLNLPFFSLKLLPLVLFLQAGLGKKSVFLTRCCH